MNVPWQTWLEKADVRPAHTPKLDCLNCSKPVKCCAFQPFVPNFLLGAILEKRRLPQSDQTVFTPLGLVPSLEYQKRFLGTKEHDASFSCAFLDGNRNCTVWEFRPSECAGYFCEESIFNERSHDLFEWENVVAQMVLVEQGFDIQQINLMMDWLEHDLTPSLETFWLGRDRDQFYLECWNWAKEQAGKDILSWLNPQVRSRFDSWVSFA
jgi:Fe-S-cluster containining protein